MPRSVYFSEGYKGEQDLYESIVNEGLRIYGINMFYLPRSLITRDLILNHDVESRFNEAYVVEMYVENTNGFEGDSALMSKFGIQLRDQATLIVSKRQWERLVGFWNNNIDINRPQEGDVIYVPFSRSFFEIKFVDARQPFYQLLNLPVYRMECELFEYNEEIIDTGIPEIDLIHAKFSTKHLLETTGDARVFDIGERINQDQNGIIVSGTISKRSENSIEVFSIKSSDFSSKGFLPTDADQGIGPAGTDKNQVDITGVNNLTFSNDSVAQNSVFNQTSNDFIDFTQINPFKA